MFFFAQAVGNAELGGMVLIALALVKVIEKAWDAQAAKRAKQNGDDPLAVVSGLLERTLERHGESVAELKTIAARQLDISERMERRMEKVERLLIILLERTQVASDHGKIGP